MRVSLWWSFYVNAKDPREVETIHLPQVAAQLGHGLQMRDGSIEADAKRAGVYHVDAWSYLEAQTVPQAGTAALREALALSDSVRAPQAFNAAPNENEDAIIAFYWDDCEAAGLPNVRSSGLMASCNPQLDPATWPDLSAYEAESRAGIEALRNDILAAPLIDLGPADAAQRDYQLDLDLRIYASTSAKLLDQGWPEVRKKWFNGDAELIQVAKRPYDRGPFRLKARKYLDRITQDQAVASCLQFGAHGGLTVEADAAGLLTSVTGLHATHDQGVNNIVGYTLTRA